MRPISQRRRAGKPYGCLALFCGAFLAVGGLFFYFFFLRPVVGLLAARSWTEASCVVLESRVAYHAGSKGTTYKPDILYSYSVGGTAYQSRRYNMLDVYSSGYDGKAEIVARYPPGRQTSCWVDPTDPSRAVLTRDFTPGYLAGLLPLIFVAAGGFGLVWALRQSRTARVASLAAAGPGNPATPFGVVIPAEAGSPLELRPKATRLGTLLGLIFVSIFWNGIVSVFFWQAVQLWRAGTPNGCMTAFLVPFVIIGLLLIFGVIRQFLVLFNPRLKITLSRGVLAPGEPVQLQWALSSQGTGVRRLRIVLEGREEATYRRGTDTCTDRETFASIVVVDTDQPFAIPAGSTTLEVPAGTMPSFVAEHNKVLWMLKATCEIKGWPDSDDEYEVVVTPSHRFGGWS
jgi:uncharacterized membrane protein